MPGKAIVLMYHNIARPPAKGRLKGLYVSLAMFRFQMWYLKVAGFVVVPLHGIAASVKHAFLDKKVIALTFDDGYEDSKGRRA